ncbi:MAG: hypothetical protein ACREX9_00715, partial [Gammaproteobacteria bacterium]
DLNTRSIQPESTVIGYKVSLSDLSPLSKLKDLTSGSSPQDDLCHGFSLGGLYSPVLLSCSNARPFWIAVTRFDQPQRSTAYKIEGMGDDRIEAVLGSRELNDRPLGRRQIDRLGTIVARVIGRQIDPLL